MCSVVGSLAVCVLVEVDLVVYSVQACAADRFAAVHFVFLGCLLHSQAASLVVVGEVAGLTHPNRIVKSVGMLTVPSQLISAELTVARRTHILGVVLAMDVRALCDLH